MIIPKSTGTIGQDFGAIDNLILLFQMKISLAILVLVGLQGLLMEVFLEANGFGHLQNFEAEEVGITQVVDLSNENWV